MQKELFDPKVDTFRKGTIVALEISKAYASARTVGSVLGASFGFARKTATGISLGKAVGTALSKSKVATNAVKLAQSGKIVKGLVIGSAAKGAVKGFNVEVSTLKFDGPRIPTVETEKAGFKGALIGGGLTLATDVASLKGAKSGFQSGIKPGETAQKKVSRTLSERKFNKKLKLEVEKDPFEITSTQKIPIISLEQAKKAAEFKLPFGTLQQSLAQSEAKEAQVLLRGKGFKTTGRYIGTNKGFALETIQEKPPSFDFKSIGKPSKLTTTGPFDKTALSLLSKAEREALLISKGQSQLSGIPGINSITKARLSRISQTGIDTGKQSRIGDLFKQDLPRGPRRVTIAIGSEQAAGIKARQLKNIVGVGKISQRGVMLSSTVRKVIIAPTVKIGGPVKIRSQFADVVVNIEPSKPKRFVSIGRTSTTASKSLFDKLLKQNLGKKGQVSTQIGGFSTEFKSAFNLQPRGDVPEIGGTIKATTNFRFADIGGDIAGGILLGGKSFGRVAPPQVFGTGRIKSIPDSKLKIDPVGDTKTIPSQGLTLIPRGKIKEGLILGGKTISDTSLRGRTQTRLKPPPPITPQPFIPIKTPFGELTKGRGRGRGFKAPQPVKLDFKIPDFEPRREKQETDTKKKKKKKKRAFAVTPTLFGVVRKVKFIGTSSATKTGLSIRGI